MEKIGELFQKDVSRRIEEVIKVDQHDEETVKNEIEEYIVTDSIRDYYRLVLDEYNRGRTDPSEGIGIWVSGFFWVRQIFFCENPWIHIICEECYGGEHCRTIR